MALRPQLSAAIITRNEAHRIGRCLDALAFADETIVLDSGSDDGTADVARSHGARVVVDPAFPGFGPQKNRALALTTGQWVLSIDADEVVTPDLRDAILRAVRDPQAANGYWVRRGSTWCGQRIRHGDWRDDRVLRLFRREAARFSDDLVHERVLCPPPHGELDGILLHDSVDSLPDARAKMLRYARLGADKLRARGRGGWVPACTHAFWTFVRGYVVRGGLLDGAAGLRIAATNARGTFLRYRWAALPASRVPAGGEPPAAPAPAPITPPEPPRPPESPHHRSPPS